MGIETETDKQAGRQPRTKRDRDRLCDATFTAKREIVRHKILRSLLFIADEILHRAKRVILAGDYIPIHSCSIAKLPTVQSTYLTLCWRCRIDFQMLYHPTF